MDSKKDDRSTLPPVPPKPPGGNPGILAGLTDVKLSEDTIQDVQSETNKLIKGRFGDYVWLIGLLYVFWAAVCVVIWVSLGVADINNAKYFIFLLLVPAFAAGYYYSIIQRKVAKKFYQQFAFRNNFVYSENTRPAGLDGELFTYGKDINITNIVSGITQGHNVVLTNLEYAIGSGKSRKNFEFTVFCIDYIVMLPPILLLIDGIDVGWNVTKTSFENLSKIELPLEVEQHFNLFTERKFEIEALQIFTLDFLNQLHETYQDYAFEFKQTKLYVYRRGIILRKEDLEKMFGLVEIVTRRLSPQLRRMEAGVVEMHRLINK